MKQILFSILLVAQTVVFANMAEPVIHGTMSARAFTNENVDILREELNIVLDADFKTASYEVIYSVQSAKNGTQIPLLFYAINYSGDFQVSIDGKRIDQIILPNGNELERGFPINEFNYFNEENEWGEGNLSVSIAESQWEIVSLEDLIYFKVDIPSGEHEIRVTYDATVWVDMWDAVKKYDFKYSLSPAEYWKSFGTLDLTIDATAVKHPITVNIGNPHSGDVNGVGKWSFVGIPAPTLEISYRPEINGTAQFFMDLGGLNLALIIGFLFAILHHYWMYSYRRKHPNVKYSTAMIIGAFLVPLIFLLVWEFSFDWIAYLIGPDASKNYSYRILAFLGYPILLIPYWLVSWGFDRVDRRKLQKQ